MKKKFNLPPALIIVAIVLMFVAVLTWFIPTSIVVENDEGVKEIVYNAEFIDEDTGEYEEGTGTSPAGLWDVVKAPVTGFQYASDVVIAILIAGMFLSVLNSVGAMDAGISSLINKFSGSALIIALMLAFSAMGTVSGLWEEIVVYSIVIVPLLVLAGYDVMTGIAVMFVGATVGNMASVVNPFSTGAAISAIGNDELSMGSGIVLRLLIFVVLQVVATTLVLKYANKVKKDKTASVVYGEEVKEIKENASIPQMTRKRALSLAVYIICVLATIVGYIPWDSIALNSDKFPTMFELINYPQEFLMDKIPFLGEILGADTFTPWGWWYFDEYSIVFLIGTVLLFIINRMPIEEFVDSVIAGAKDLISVCVVLAVAKGISVIMGSRTSGMSVTFVYWIQNTLESVPVWAFVFAAILAFLAIGLFIQSTSGVAGITMPILGAVAGALFAASDIGTVGGQIILISTYTVGLNFMSSVYPGATIMGTLDIFNVKYSTYLSFMLRITVVLLVIAAIILAIAPILNLV